MKITDIQLIRCMSGHGEDAVMVGRLTWQQDGKEFGTETRCGEQEEDLLEALEECVAEMLNRIAGTISVVASFEIEHEN